MDGFAVPRDSSILAHFQKARIFLQHTKLEKIKFRERNLLYFFESLGKDLKQCPKANVSPESLKFFEESVKVKHCYETAHYFWDIINETKDRHEVKNVKVWFGYMDSFSNKGYERTWRHGFVTIIRKDDTEIILDPLHELRRLQGKGEDRHRNHFGVYIPITIVLDLCIDAVFHDLNYGGYLTNVIFRSTEKTKALVRKIKQEYKKEQKELQHVQQPVTSS